MSLEAHVNFVVRKPIIYSVHFILRTLRKDTSLSLDLTYKYATCWKSDQGLVNYLC